MSEEHEHGHGSNLRRVQTALVITGVFMLVEVAGGILSGSLALLADAGHMLTDTMALLLSVVAFRVSSRPPDARRSYGYQRFQIIAAFVNGLSLLLIVGWIVVEAVMRLLDPPDVIGPTMLVVAVVGLLVNIAAFFVLHGGDQENLNIRGAALHVLGDLLGSVAAILAAVIIIQTAWMPIDPLLSMLVALLIFRSAWTLVRRSGHILLEGAPEWLDTNAIRDGLVDAIPEVKGIHHVHAWALTPQHPMMTMHVVLQEPVVNSTTIVRSVKQFLATEFAITHSTIEIEFDDCADHGDEG